MINDLGNVAFAKNRIYRHWADKICNDYFANSLGYSLRFLGVPQSGGLCDLTSGARFNSLVDHVKPCDEIVPEESHDVFRRYVV